MVIGGSGNSGRHGRGRRFVVLLAFILAGVTIAAIPPGRVAAECQLTLGFKSLHDLIPAVVGDCLANEQHDPLTGDATQPTTGANGAGGLLVWRRFDNDTAYTDG